MKQDVVNRYPVPPAICVHTSDHIKGTILCQTCCQEWRDRVNTTLNSLWGQINDLKAIADPLTRTWERIDRALYEHKRGITKLPPAGAKRPVAEPSAKVQADDEFLKSLGL